MIEFHGGPKDGEVFETIRTRLVSVLSGGERHIYERVKLPDGRLVYGWVGLKESVDLSLGGGGRS